MDSKNKLVRAISAEELQAFLDELAGTPGVDGPMIQRLAVERFGVEMGHTSANHFRKEVFHAYLERMRARRVKAKEIAKLREEDEDTARTLADAASDELQQQVFDFLTEQAPLDLSEKDDLKRAEALSRIIKSARSEDRKMITALREENERLKTQQKEASVKLVSAAKDAGASPQLVATIREALNFRVPEVKTQPQLPTSDAAQRVPTK